MRADVLKVCHTVEGTTQRYLCKEEFQYLNRYDKCDAVLWLVAPTALQYRVIHRIVNRDVGYYLSTLVRQGRALHVGYGMYRFRHLRWAAKGVP